VQHDVRGRRAVQAHALLRGHDVHAKLADGASCLAANQCTSGACADSVCCNSVCGGTCEACNLAGSVGTCSAVPPGPTRRPSVRAGWRATGAGVQRDLRGGFALRGDLLLQREQRVRRQAGDRGASSCTAPQSMPERLCTDGLCCGSLCGGTCEACNLAGTVGACTAVPASQDPAAECAGGLSCDGSRACRTTCAVDGDCEAALLLRGSACVARRATSATCSADNQCASGNCATGPAATRPAGAR